MTYPDQIPLGRFIFERLRQLNIGTIFGLPGDFNLALLDHIDEVEGLRWAGNANELNASYAADGYARVKGLACIVTTFGVGELSAVNGIAGSFAEHVPVVHIVGVPSTKATEEKLLLHHTLGDGRFDVFKKISKEISYRTTTIDDINTATAQFDKIVRDAYVHKRPVYVALPSNFVEMTVPTSSLQTKIDLSLPPNEPEAEIEALQTITDLAAQASNPIILVDACALRHEVRNLVSKLADVTQFPIFATPMGKSGISEDHPRFGGIYVGVLSKPDVKKAVETADLVISIGGLLSDFNTGSFSYHYSTKNVVELHSNYTKVKAAIYEGVQMQFLLEKLIEALPTFSKSYKPVALPQSPHEYLKLKTDTNEKLTQEWLWKRISTFIKPGDVIVSETGTSAFGIIQTHFPDQVIGISQVLYGSIGFATGCAAGAAFAAEEIDPKKRVILFTGEGSLQLTVQAISDCCRWKLNPYLFVLNNNGYTIEKLIHGPHKQYNNIQPWDHSKILELFSTNHEYENYKIATVKDADALLNEKEFNDPSKIRMIELVLDSFDAPQNLVQQAKISEQTNAA
uniref:Pyruvate decarboxylase n=1 Tax=[Candida] sonorensis TaxID=51926 RepID=S0BDX8_9ASCO|nr:pyruvate decarboxylase [[Candida] sonorensis]